MTERAAVVVAATLLAFLVLCAAILGVDAFTLLEPERAWGMDPCRFCPWFFDTHFWRPAARQAGYRAAFYETVDVPWCRALRDAHAALRDEWDAFAAGQREGLPIVGDVLPGQGELSGSTVRDDGDGKWRAAVLRVYGRDTPLLAACFPRTAHILARHVPNCTTAMFSLLEPGRRLHSHTGPNHAVLRYHLGIRIPRDWWRCAISVAGVTRHWHDGADLLCRSGFFGQVLRPPFDDTLSHSAYNETEEDRVVLFLDVPRPFVGAAVSARFTRMVAYGVLFPHHRAVRRAARTSASTLLEDNIKSTQL